MTRALPAVLLSGLLLAGACSGGDHAPILLVGIDGLEWRVLLPMLADDELPNLNRLVEEGSYGLLRSMHPTFSPIVWTTIATSKTPREHGIQGFVKKGESGLYTSGDRRTKAFWEILSDYRRRVAVVGWWITYPAEPVNGVMVAQVNTVPKQSGRGILKGDLVEGLGRQTFPPELADECLAIHARMRRNLAGHTRRVFGEFRHPLEGTPARLWDQTQWAFLADATYAEIAAGLAGDGYDLLAVYFGGADVVGHRFWRYMQPELYSHPPTTEEIENLGRVIPDYYRWIDSAIGRIVAAMPPDVTVIVVSDHGMQPVNRRRPYNPNDLPRQIRSGNHPRALPGAFLMAGPGVRQGPELDAASTSHAELPIVASVHDVTPTLLAMLAVPTGADMKGRVLTELLTSVPRIRTIASHDTPEWLATRGDVDPTLGDDPERLEQLRALGYLD